MDWLLAIIVFVGGYFIRKILKYLTIGTGMKKFISLMVTFVVTLFTLNALAFDPPPPPENGWYVADLAHKMTQSQIKTLNDKIEATNKATGNEFGVLLLSDMGGDNIEDVAHATYQKWGIGKKGLDNGCLIVVAIKERKSRIETGKGVEGEVPDLKANDILKRNLNPHLRNGDFYGGFASTLTALQSQIETRRAEKAAATAPPAALNGEPQISTGNGSFFIFFLMLGCTIAMGIVIFMVVSHLRAKAEEERQLAEARVRRELDRQRRLREQREREEREAREAEERKRRASMPTPSVPVPSVRPVSPSTRPTVPRPTPKTTSSIPPSNASAAAAAAAASAEAQQARLRKEKREREEREAAEARRRRDEEDRRRREREEEDRRSSYSSSSSSSFDWGGSWGGGSDSGSGFGGGDSGGGGSSSDW